MSDIGKLKRLLGRGIIDRRSLMVCAAALGIAVIAAGALGTQALAQEPKKGGTLRLGIGHGSTTDSLDPATYENLYMQTLGGTIHNTLTVVGNTGELEPELAESWEASEDATEWRFKLRPGVTFHNGAPLTPEDVVVSIDHHRGEESTSAAKPIVEPIQEISADGDDTVVFTLENGNADFPYLVSDYHLPIMPSESGEIVGGGEIGAGSYKLATFEPGVRATVERFEEHWNEETGHVDGAEMLVILDQTARTNALQTGEVDVIDRVDLKTLPLLARQPNIEIVETEGNAHYTFAMRTDAAPFDNNDVRLALKYAMDRQELLDKVLKGHGYLGNDHPIGKADRFHADLPQREYDIEKAKEHLKKAGLETLQVDLHAADAAFPGAVDAAILYKEQAAPAGIEINVVREPNDGYWSNVWMVEPFSAVYWGGRPTADWMFSMAYAAGVPWNDSFWEHERFNELLVEARSELDDAKRQELYTEMQEIVMDEGGVIVPMFNNYIMALSDKVGHGEVGNNWALDGFRAVERWWLEE
ncbi:MAG TPA: ABC transporter substrate-binding protein [Thermohalobaculum sp.]|nr:ABC transporter substrate-binding protein [Thermohalobaculum sp.]